MRLPVGFYVDEGELAREEQQRLAALARADVAKRIADDRRIAEETEACALIADEMGAPDVAAKIRARRGIPLRLVSTKT